MLQVPRAQFLFPLAVQMPGFHHICDNILKHVTCTLPWFPKCLQELKALIKVCSIVNNRDILVTNCR
jgi:hypothetical protein